MKKYKIPLIISLIVLLVLSVSVGAFLLQKETNEDISPIIFDTLILPYSQAVSNQDYKSAYENFTTEKYKLKHSYSEYESAQIENYNYFGKLDSMKLTSGIFVFIKDAERKWVYRGTIDYFAEKQNIKFAVDVIEVDGKYKISRTYPSQMTIRASAPQIF